MTLLNLFELISRYTKEISEYRAKRLSFLLRIYVNSAKVFVLN